MSEVISLSADNFDSITSRGIVLVEFYAPWCGPCKMLTPIVEQLAAEYEEIVFAKGNIEDLPQHCMRFGIRSVPEILIFKNGEIVSQLNGMQNRMALMNALEAVLFGF